MVHKLLEQDIGIYAMVILCVFGMAGNFLCMMGWNSLLKASEHIGTTKHKLIQEMKKRFETCYKMHINVHKVDKYVDKYIYKHKFCGLNLCTWGNLCGQLLCITTLIGIISSILLCVYHSGQDKILMYILTTVVCVGMLITYQYRVNAVEKSKRIAVNLQDYFENYLIGRLEAEQSNPELVKQYQADAKSYMTEQHRVEKAKKQRKEKKIKKNDRRQEMEKLKQELVEELKQERMLQKEKEAKRLAAEAEANAAMQQGAQEIAAASVKKIMDKPPKLKQEKQILKPELKKEEEKIVQDILKEYLA